MTTDGGVKHQVLGSDCKPCGYCDKVVDQGLPPGQHGYVRCYLCSVKWHYSCVEGFYRGQPGHRVREVSELAKRESWLCPHCRLKHLDQFYSVHANLGPKKMMVRDKQSTTCSEVTFQVDGTQMVKWRNEDYQIHVRAVRCDKSDFTGPCWPYTVQLYVNGEEKTVHRNKPIVAPPQLGHHRKEEPHINLTPFLTHHSNTVKLVGRFYTDTEKLEDGEPSRYFCLCLVIVKPLEWNALRAKVSASLKGTIGLSSVKSGNRADWRIREYFKKQKLEEEDIQVVNENADSESRSLSLNCPLSQAKIQIPVIGKYCQTEHIQTFDLSSYLETQTQIKNHNQRWQCPVCKRRCRMFDLRYCLYTSEILRSAKWKATNELRKSKGLSAIEDRDIERCKIIRSADGANGESGETGRGSIGAKDEIGANSVAYSVMGGKASEKKAKEELDMLSKVEIVDEEENLEEQMELEEFMDDKVIINEDASYSFDYAAAVREERNEKHGEVVDIDEDSVETKAKRQKLSETAIKKESIIDSMRSQQANGFQQKSNDLQQSNEPRQKSPWIQENLQRRSNDVAPRVQQAPQGKQQGGWIIQQGVGQQQSRSVTMQEPGQQRSNSVTSVVMRRGQPIQVNEVIELSDSD